MNYRRRRSLATPRRLVPFLAAAVLLALPGPTARGQDLGTYPAWKSYAITEALIMGRDNQSANDPLIVESLTDPANVLLSGQDLQFPFGGGVRAFYGVRNPDQNGWEVGYFGLYGQSASAATSLPAGSEQFLQAPGGLGDLLTSEAQSATVTWNSTINSAEVNVFSNTIDWSDRYGTWRSVDWLAGFRYVGVEESATIGILSCEGAGPPVPYGVHTSSNLFGFQLGTRRRIEWQRWALEGWAKAAVMGGCLQQRQDAVVDWLAVQVRDPQSSTKTDVGFVGDINLSAIYRLNDIWGIRAGYNTIWINGVALAPNQFSYALDSAANPVRGGDGIFLHGANLGLEARW